MTETREGNGSSRTDDLPYINMAIEQARLCLAEDANKPRPKVGAVVVTASGEVVAGYRGELEKGEHAEFTVMEKKLKDRVLVDGTLFTTLEPCITRNDPKVSCAHRILERKLRRVVIGILDPNPDVLGKGVQILRNANIEVSFFPRAEMAQVEELNRDFARPYLKRTGTNQKRASASWRSLAAVLLVPLLVVLLIYWAYPPSLKAPAPTESQLIPVPTGPAGPETQTGPAPSPAPSVQPGPQVTPVGSATQAGRLWVTYAWADNQGVSEHDIDYLIQEIEAQGIEVRYDRKDAVVGRRLWEQIADKIANPADCDAWLFVATEKSLASEPCREELSYALNRALQSRTTFPMIGLVLGGDVGAKDLPPALQVRLWVSTTEKDWAARVASGVRGQVAPLAGPTIAPIFSKLTMLDASTCVLEIRRRVGTWSPFVFSLPEAEWGRYLGATYAPSGCWDAASTTANRGPWNHNGRTWYGVTSPPVGNGTCALLRFRYDGTPLSVRFGQGESGPDAKDAEIYELVLQPN